MAKVMVPLKKNSKMKKDHRGINLASKPERHRVCGMPGVTHAVGAGRKHGCQKLSGGCGPNFSFKSCTAWVFVTVASATAAPLGSCTDPQDRASSQLTLGPHEGHENQKRQACSTPLRICICRSYGPIVTTELRLSCALIPPLPGNRMRASAVTE
jgi:hypothetical protein